MPWKGKQMKSEEVRPAIEKLTEMGLTIASTPEIKELFKTIKMFLDNDDRLDVFIPLIKTNRIIRGELETELGKQTWIKLEHLQNS